jgi:hypothetical protein
MPKVTRLSNFNGMKKIEIIKNYATYKVMIITVIKNSTKQIIYILKIISARLLNKIIHNKSVTLFLSLENIISFGHVIFKTFIGKIWHLIKKDLIIILIIIFIQQKYFLNLLFEFCRF